MCLRDIEAGKQVTVILKTGVICIAIMIFVNSSLFMNDQDVVDQSYSDRPSHERVISSISNQELQKTNSLTKFEELDLLEYDPGQVTLVNDSHTPGELGKFGPGSKSKGRARGDSPYSTSKSLDKLAKQLSQAEFHAGRGARKLPGTKTIYYMRAGNKGRLFFRYSKKERGAVEIVSESNKKLEDSVIDNIK